MIQMGVNPVAFTLGPWSFRWYGVMVLLAIAFLVGWSLYFAKRGGYSRDFMLGAGLWAVPLGFVGAKLVHLIDNMSYYLAYPSDILNPAGLAIFGAILGGVLGVWVHCSLRRVPFAPLADLAAPGIILAQAIGRIGCTINGCCYGTPSSLPWAVSWTHPDSYAPLGVAVHPTQLYELLWDLVVFALLWWLLRHRFRAPGTLFATYLALYSVGSFTIRFWRGDVATFAGILNEGQVLAALILVAATRFLLKPWTLREARGGD